MFDLPPADCCLSSIVAAERWTGLAKSPGPDRSRKLEEFVSLFPVLGFDVAPRATTVTFVRTSNGRARRLAPSIS